MNWSLLSTIVFGCFGIAGVVLMIRASRKKRPVWDYFVREIIGLGSDAPPEVKVSFNDREIKELYRAVIVFFNNGNQAIRREDVVKSVVVDFGDGQILKDPVLLAISREENDFSVNRVEDNRLELGFEYLGHRDGACIEVLHSGGKLPAIGGTIIDTPIKRVRGFAEEMKSPSVVGAVMMGIGFVFVAVYAGIMLSYLLSHMTEPIESWRIGLTGVAIAMVCTFGVALLVDVHRILRIRMFPSWSRDISIRIVEAKLTRIGEPIVAYCVKCRSKREMVDITPARTHGGRSAFRGRCIVCGTKMLRIGR
jgi:hypothetical protein